MTDMISTQLTVSVQGKKGAGKSVFAREVIVAAVEAIGGAVAQLRDDSNGVFIIITLPQGALASSGAPRVVSCDRAAPLGDDVEIRDGVVRAKDFPRALIEIGTDSAEVLSALINRRHCAGWMVDDPVRRSATVSAPRWVPRDLLDRMVEDSARAEIRNVDAELAAMGFIYREGGKS